MKIAVCVIAQWNPLGNLPELQFPQRSRRSIESSPSESCWSAYFPSFFPSFFPSLSFFFPSWLSLFHTAFASGSKFGASRIIFRAYCDNGRSCKMRSVASTLTSR